MSLALLFVMLSVACARVTRLIVADDFPPVLAARRWIVGRRDDRVAYQPVGRTSLDRPYQVHWWLGELVTCPWCASGWVSLGAWLATWWFVPLPLPALWWPAIWGGAAWLAGKLWQ